MSKRGQISLFIIIGILLIVLLSIIMFLQSKKTEEINVFSGQEFSSPEEQRLFDFVSNCIKDSVADALQIMSIQGGYIDFPSSVITEQVENDQGLTVYIDDNGIKRVRQGNGINLVPYWVTKNSISIPSRTLMESQLSDYIDKRVKVCTSDFDIFKQENFDVQAGDISSDVTIGTSLLVKMNYPVRLIGEDTEYFIDEYTFGIPVNFEKLIDISEQLVLYEVFNPYLEYHTMKLLGFFSGIDEDKIPPTYASRVNLDCDYVTWSKTNVQEQVKAILNANIPDLKFKGTKFEKIEDNDFYDGMIMDILDDDYDDVMVDVDYPAYFRFDFNILPSNGEMLRPSSYSGTGIPMLPMLCVHSYRFKYYIDYPVLFSIKDESSANFENGKIFTNRGYTFHYLMNTFVVGNQPRKFVAMPGQNPIIDEEQLKQYAKEQGAAVFDNEGFCSELKSKGFTLNVYDPDYNDLDKVDVYYACGAMQNNCYLGRTSDGVLGTKMPNCFNGLLILNKQGYATSYQRFTSIDADEDEIVVVMHPYEEYDLEVKKIDLKQWILTQGNMKSMAVDLAEDDSAIITMENTPNALLSYPGGGSLRLATGTFPLTIQITDDEQDMPVMGITAFNWVIPQSDLDSGSEVVLYALTNSFGVIDEDGNINATITAEGEVVSPELDNGTNVFIRWQDYINQLRPDIR